MKSSKPKLIVNTPIRSREMSQAGQIGQPVSNRGLLTPSRLNKENASNMPQNEFYTNKSSLSPNKVSASRKPTINLKPNLQQYSTLPNQQEAVQVQSQWRQTKPVPALPTNSRRECVNHPEKEAEFRITIEGEVMQYCAKCSAHLASQGFAVEKLAVDGRSARKSSISVAASPINAILQTKTMQNVDPSIISHPRYNQIMGFLETISDVDEELRKNAQSFTRLPSHYKEQIQLLDEFYDAMIDYMKHVKSQHLNLIKGELRKYVQVGEIECGDIDDCTAELDSIVSDMQGNINSIVKEVTEDKYRECFNFYSQKVELYKHRAEEQSATLSEVTQMGKQQLNGKLQEFRNAVNQMFGIKQVSSMSQQQQQFPCSQNLSSIQNNSAARQPTPMTKKSTMQSQRQPSAGPFRNLFDAEEVAQMPQGLPDESPQFKNI